ncbi:MAG: universal stress protein [Candidatus Manganitrophaceae bacterium]
MDNPRRILLGTDFSDYSKEALDYALFLAKSFEAELYLFHAFEQPVFMPGVNGRVGPEIITWIQGFKEEGWKKLEALAEKMKKEGVKAHPLLKEGVPYREMLNAAKEVKADLIVLGTHGRSGLDRFMMGSVAERVVRQAPCPVFLVKPAGLRVAKGEIKE